MSETQTIGDESGTIRDFTAFQQNILVILAEEPVYGLAIKYHLESYHDTEVSRGRLYPDLDDLVEMGLAEKDELGERMNQHELTDDGLQAALDRFDWMLAKFVTDDERAEMVPGLIENKL